MIRFKFKDSKCCPGRRRLTVNGRSWCLDTDEVVFLSALDARPEHLPPLVVRFYGASEIEKAYAAMEKYEYQPRPLKDARRGGATLKRRRNK